MREFGKIKFRGMDAWVSEQKISLDDLGKVLFAGLHHYEIRSRYDDPYFPDTVELAVLEGFCGTMITDKEIVFPKYPGSYSKYIILTNDEITDISEWPKDVPVYTIDDIIGIGCLGNPKKFKVTLENVISENREGLERL